MTRLLFLLFLFAAMWSAEGATAVAIPSATMSLSASAALKSDATTPMAVISKLIILLEQKQYYEAFVSCARPEDVQHAKDKDRLDAICQKLEVSAANDVAVLKRISGKDLEREGKDRVRFKSDNGSSFQLFKIDGIWYFHWR